MLGIVWQDPHASQIRENIPTGEGDDEEGGGHTDSPFSMHDYLRYFSGTLVAYTCSRIIRFQSVIYNSKNYDILICLTETWLNSMISNNEILPPTYTI